jgi:glycosyltransferase involved in cell wall biosynthesis
MSTSINSLQIGMHWFGERPGGLDRVFKALIESLPAQGVNVRGMVAGSTRVFDESGGQVHAFADAEDPLSTRMWQARRHSRQLKRALRPDVVASHFALYTVPTTGVFARIPRVVHFHGPWADESAVEGRSSVSRIARHALEKSVYRNASRHIVLSRAFGDLLRNRYGVPEERIRIVPGCVDVERFNVTQTKTEVREALGLPTDRPLIFCIRRLVSRMGLEELIDAMFVVRQTVPDALLVIAGTGPLEPALRATIAARRLENHVRLAGFVPDETLPFWYRSADVTIVPTLSLEGFGLTTIESLASGTPVLVTPVGGLPEAVAPLSPELVLPSIGYQAIAAGISDALRGKRVLPDEAACREYARARFDNAVVAAQVARVYREAVGEQ